MPKKQRKLRMKWDSVNLSLAIILLLLVLVIAGKLAHTWWQNSALQPDKVVVTNQFSNKKVKKHDINLSMIAIDHISYKTGVDFLHLPTLVVSYRMKNNSDTQALPPYVFNQKIRFHQLTAYKTSTILAESDLADGQLRGVDVNYFENQDIMLLPKQTVTVIQTFRLESLNRPVTVQVVEDGQTQKFMPSQLSGVKK